MLPLIRILIGLLFIVSGAEKLIWPYQNFMYVLEGYQLFSPGVESLIARVFPWVEFILGIFMVLGFWLPITLRGVLATFTVFILVIGQALIRKLPIDECGCFGSLISLKPQQTLFMDSFCFLALVWLNSNVKAAARFSLDNYLSKQ
jgi:uncharacterized membrane protein YphA (DoxX/SURF4 family)